MNRADAHGKSYFCVLVLLVSREGAVRGMGGMRVFALQYTIAGCCSAASAAGPDGCPASEAHLQQPPAVPAPAHAPRAPALAPAQVQPAQHATMVLPMQTVAVPRAAAHSELAAS